MAWLFEPVWWLLAGLALGLAELAMPVFVFLGFGVAAVVTAAVVWLVGAPDGGGVDHAWPLAVFAVLSLGAVLALRRLRAVRAGHARVGRRDVNEQPYRGDRE